MRGRPLATLAVAVLMLAGCGGEDEEDSGVVPAAGENTPAAGTPGVPEGAPYDLDGRQWGRLSPAEAERIAAAYVADQPERCRDADPELVADYVTASYGYDFGPGVPAAEVLAEGCDAARQS